LQEIESIPRTKSRNEMRMMVPDLIGVSLKVVFELFLELIEDNLKRLNRNSTLLC